MAALVAALWAYDGWNDLNQVAGEIRDPGRNIPIALIVGVAIVGVLYILVNAGVQYVLPAHAIADSPRPASDAVAMVLGALGASIVSAGMALSMLVHLNGTTMSGARVPFAAARDGYFFPGVAQSPSPVPDAFGRDPAATRSGGRAITGGAKLSSAVHAGHFCGMAVLHDHGQHGFRLPAARTRRPASLPRVGLSCCACAVCFRVRDSALLHLHRQSSRTLPSDAW